MPRQPKPPNSEPKGAQVLEALERVLTTDKFQTAPQMSAFLDYVVKQVVDGNQNRIKAYTVAVDALGKPPTFDPQNDPVVRVLAGRLRASLTAYYDTQPDTDVYIQMKPGSYVPTFLHYSAGAEIPVILTAEGGNMPATANEHDATQPIATVHDKSASNTAQATANLSADELPEPDATSKPAHQASTNGTELAAFLASFLRFPTVGVLLILVSVGAAVVVKRALPDQAAQPPTPSLSKTVEPAMEGSTRPRPDKVSVFVDASSGSDLLSDDLNAILSGVFLESSEIRVYRVLDGVKNKRYWPEDYLVSLEVMPLQSETRVSVQLVDAQTGLVRHSDNLILSDFANKSLTHEELKKIREFGRQLASKNGPLLLDYQRKSQSLSSSED